MDLEREKGDTSWAETFLATFKRNKGVFRISIAGMVAVHDKEDDDDDNDGEEHKRVQKEEAKRRESNKLLPDEERRRSSLSQKEDKRKESYLKTLLPPLEFPSLEEAMLNLAGRYACCRPVDERKRHLLAVADRATGKVHVIGYIPSQWVTKRGKKMVLTPPRLLGTNLLDCGLYHPTGITWDDFDNLIVSDTGHDRLVAIRPHGCFLHSFSTLPLIEKPPTTGPMSALFNNNTPAAASAAASPKAAAFVQPSPAVVVFRHATKKDSKTGPTMDKEKGAFLFVLGNEIITMAVRIEMICQQSSSHKSLQLKSLRLPELLPPPSV